MQTVLIRAGCFVAIIILGFVLRRTGFFPENTFSILSKIVLKITLPASVVASFSGKEIDPSLLTLALLGFGFGVIYMLLGWVLNLRRGIDRQVFGIINLSGYNIGNFTMPFVQSFLGPMGVITTSLFDTGNACICLGGAFGVASSVKEGGTFNVKIVLKALSRSTTFLCYVLMTVLCLCRVTIPGPIVSLAEIIGGGNAFLAMLMLGVGFKVEANREQIGRIVRHLALRYGLAAVFALFCWFALPFEASVRQALVILVFSPIATACPAYTGELKNEVGLAAAVNSISIIISIVIIVTLLTVMA